MSNTYSSRIIYKGSTVNSRHKYNTNNALVIGPTVTDLGSSIGWCANKIIFGMGKSTNEYDRYPAIYYSLDDGENWTEEIITNLIFCSNISLAMNSDGSILYAVWINGDGVNVTQRTTAGWGLWGDIETFSCASDMDNTNDDLSIACICDKNDVLHIIYPYNTYSGGTETYSLRHAIRNSANNYTHNIITTNIGSISSNPCRTLMDIDSNNTIHIVYASYNATGGWSQKLYYAQYTTAWTVPAIIVTEAAQVSYPLGGLVISADDSLHLIYTNWTAYVLYRSCTASVWSATTTISTVSSGNSALNRQCGLSIDKNDNITAVYLKKVGANYSLCKKIKSAGVWGSESTLFTQTATTYLTGVLCGKYPTSNTLASGYYCTYSDTSTEGIHTFINHRFAGERAWLTPTEKPLIFNTRETPEKEVVMNSRNVTVEVGEGVGENG